MLIVNELNKEIIQSWNNKMVDHFVYYKACQFRWEETADPIIEDIKNFKTLDEAIEYAKGIKLNIGFYPTIDKYIMVVSELDADDLMLEIDNVSFDVENDVWNGDVNNGDEIKGAIIVEWNFEKYVGYARNLVQVGIAGNYPFDKFNYESDLISGNEERTFHSNYSILLTSKEIAESDNLEEDINEKLTENHWKWNYFKNNPKSTFIQEMIENLIN